MLPTIKTWIRRKGPAAALVAALLAVGATYAAAIELSGPAGRHASPLASAAGAKKRLPRPRITARPDAQTTSTTATFKIKDKAKHVKFRCRLDALGWRKCRRSITYVSLGVGKHQFSARAVRKGSRKSRMASFAWTVSAPATAQEPTSSVTPGGVPFTITQTGAPLLYPGAGPSPLALTLNNPNPDPIFVTSLAVAASGGPPACTPAANISIQPSKASDADPFAVPANGSVTIPTAQAPTIELVNEPFNQDACRGASFTLTFSGSAHG